MCSQYMGSLKNRKLIFSQVWRFKVLDEGVAGLFATHSSILAWTIQGTEEPGELQSMGVTKESDTT